MAFAGPASVVDKSPASLRSRYLTLSRPLLLKALLFLAGILLATAALLKVRNGSMNSPLLYVLGLLELVLAAWFTSGILADAARKVLILLFAVFAISSAWRVINGDPRCDCFGSTVAVQPVQMLLVDVLVVLAASMISAGRAASGACFIWQSRSHRFALAMRFLLASLLIATTVTTLPLYATPVAGASVENWLGKPFPHDTFQWLSTPLPTSGDWEVVFIDPACGKCQGMLSDYLNRPLTEGQCVAFVDLSATRRKPILARPDILWGRVAKGRPLDVRVPFVLRVRDGVVVDAHGGQRRVHDR